MGRFRIRATWIAAPEDEELSPAERHTFAQVSIAIDETVLTRVSDPADRTYVIGPTSGLVEWIVESWVSMLWETHAPFPKSAGAGAGRARPPSLRDAARLWAGFTVDRVAMGRWQQRHTLGVASSDLALPSIVFMPEEGAVGVFVASIADDLDPLVRIVPDFDEPAWVRVEDLREVLSQFVDDTIQRAREADASTSRWATWLSALWADAKRRERDPHERLRAALGDYAAQHWAEAKAELDSDAEALRGILLDTPLVGDQAVWQRRLSDVAAVRGTAHHDAMKWPLLGSVAGLPLFAQGQQLAVELRNALSNTDSPIDPREAMEALGITWGRVDTQAFRSAAIRTHDGSARVLISREARGLARERFASSVALGRLLGDGRPPGSPLGAAHGNASRWRETQRANAFAAELLLPAAALKTHDISNKRQLCEDFGISYKAATWQIENRGGSSADRD